MELIHDIFAFELYRRPPDPVRCLVEEEESKSGGMINVYHNENGVFNT